MIIVMRGKETKKKYNQDKELTCAFRAQNVYQKPLLQDRFIIRGIRGSDGKELLPMDGGLEAPCGENIGYFVSLAIIPSPLTTEGRDHRF